MQSEWSKLKALIRSTCMQYSAQAPRPYATLDILVTPGEVGQAFADADEHGQAAGCRS